MLIAPRSKQSKQFTAQTDIECLYSRVIRSGRLDGAFETLFLRFWDRYLSKTGDHSSPPEELGYQSSSSAARGRDGAAAAFELAL